MKDILPIIQLPKVNLNERDLIIKSLNYYKISCIEFSYDTDEIIYNINNIIDVISDSSNIQIENKKQND